MRAYAKTDIGRSRKSNQDYFFVSTEPVGPLPNLFIAADGMGGHNAGDFASRFCTEHLADYVRRSSEKEPGELLSRAVREVNRELLDAASRDPELTGTGTTMVAAVIRSGICITMNIGDSRLYHVSGDRIRQITRDHSYVQKRVDMGRMEVGSPAYLRQKNYITRALGTSAAEPDLFETEVRDGDIVLLCTDGLTNMVSDEEILKVLRTEEDLETAVEKLVGLANANGGRDNITAVAVRAGEQEELC